MIQRIQTIHLLLSVAIGVVALVLSINAAPGNIVKDAFSPQVGWGRWAYLSLVGLGILLAACSIFMYKTRMRQLRIVNLSTKAYVLAYVLTGVCWLINRETIVLSCSLAILLPAISIIFNLLAARRIRFDERLVRSADRLR